MEKQLSFGVMKMTNRMKLTLIIARLCQLNRPMCNIDMSMAYLNTSSELISYMYRVLVEENRSEYEIETHMNGIEYKIKKSGYIPKGE